MSEGLKDLQWDVGRQLAWKGDGCLCVVSANAVATNVVTVKHRDTASSLASAEGPEKFLDIGMSLDFIDSNSNVVASSASITAISGQGTATVTLTLDSVVTVAANNLVIRSGSNGNEIQGLLTSLDGQTSTIYNIDRSVSIQFQGNNTDNGGQALNLNVMQQTLNNARRRGGGKISVVYCDFDRNCRLAA